MNKLRPVLDDVKVEASSLGANLKEEARSLKDEALALKEGAMKALKSPKGKSKKVFGVPLERNSAELPIVLKKCLEYFAQKGVLHEGLFRLSGNQAHLMKLRDRFEDAEDVNLLEVLDPHTVAGLMKLYFRELPEPLLTYELYDVFLATAAIPDQEAKLRTLKSVIKFLPIANYNTAKFLLAFLHEIQKEQQVNKMSPANLALVFAPALLKAPHHTQIDANDHSAQYAMLKDAPLANHLFELLINHYMELFDDAPVSVSPRAVPQPLAKSKAEFSWRTSRPVETLVPANQEEQAMLNRLRNSNRATHAPMIVSASVSSSAPLSSDMYVEMPRPKSPQPPHASAAPRAAILLDEAHARVKTPPPRPARTATVTLTATNSTPALLQPPNRTPDRHTRTISDGQTATAQKKSDSPAHMHPPPPPSMKQKPSLRKMSSSGALDGRDRGPTNQAPVPGFLAPGNASASRQVRSHTVIGVPSSGIAADHPPLPPRPSTRKLPEQPTSTPMHPQPVRVHHFPTVHAPAGLSRPSDGTPTPPLPPRP